MTDRLDGRIALVTGAAAGIGRATAERLTREGAIVVAGVADEGQRIEVASVVDNFRQISDCAIIYCGRRVEQTES